MDEFIFIERVGHKIIVEKLMLGDTIDDFPNLFTYFYISAYRPNKLDISIWRKNSNINENDLTNNSKYIIVMKYKDGQYGFTSILKGKTVKHYIKWIINKLKKKKSCLVRYIRYKRWNIYR